MRRILANLGDPWLHLLLIAVAVGAAGLWRQATERLERDDPINRAVVVYIRRDIVDPARQRVRRDGPGTRPHASERL